MEKVPIKQAAEEIGCAPEYLRRQMKAGRWPIGEVVRPPRGGTNYRYFIFRARLDKFLGKEGNPCGESESAPFLAALD